MKPYICIKNYRFIKEGQIVEIVINTNGIAMIIIDNYFKSFIQENEIDIYFKEISLYRKEQIEKL